MPPPIPIAIYLHERVSLGFALLLETVFDVANRVAAREIFEVTLIADGGRPRQFRHGITLRQFERQLPRRGYLLLPPIERLTGEFVEYPRESKLLRQAHERGLILGSSCLASFLIAAAGLVDGTELTTHWRWGDYANRRFPNVSWNTRAMVCAQRNVITAGGLLATVDLALHIVAQHCPKSVAREVGRHLLADSVRERQSTYATSLVLQPRNGERFAALEKEFDTRLAKPLSIPEMAARCAMSVRSFHRAFVESYGVPPGKYLQLRRIELAKKLLADARLTIEDVANRCGFSQPSFFRTIFARETGLTPAQFRKRL